MVLLLCVNRSLFCIKAQKVIHSLIIKGYTWNKMPPKVGTKGTKKAVTKTKAACAGGDKKGGRRRELYAIYIYKVLRHVHPDTGAPKCHQTALVV
jgi:hypothetical protein